MDYCFYYQCKYNEIEEPFCTQEKCIAKEDQLIYWKHLARKYNMEKAARIASLVESETNNENTKLRFKASKEVQ